MNDRQLIVYLLEEWMGKGYPKVLKECVMCAMPNFKPKVLLRSNVCRSMFILDSTVRFFDKEQPYMFEMKDGQMNRRFDSPFLMFNKRFKFDVSHLDIRLFMRHYPHWETS